MALKWSCDKFLAFSLSLIAYSTFASNLEPKIENKLKAPVYTRAIKDREIMVNADLQDGKRYDYYSVALIRSTQKRTHEILTDYEIFKKVVPFVSRAEFHPKEHILDLEGGIWNYKLTSSILFKEHSESWIEFEVVKGHFLGMKGDILLQNQGEQGTLVYLGGNLTGETWPPTFIMEKGAEVVLTVATQNMRGYVEEHKLDRESKATESKEGKLDEKSKKDENIPKPRSRLKQ